MRGAEQPPEREENDENEERRIRQRLKCKLNVLKLKNPLFAQFPFNKMHVSTIVQLFFTVKALLDISNDK